MQSIHHNFLHGVNGARCLQCFLIIISVVAKCYSAVPFTETFEEKEFRSVLNEKHRKGILYHVTNDDLCEDETYLDVVFVDTVTVEPMPEWEVEYGATVNGETGNTTVGVKITTERIGTKVKVTFVPMVKVIIDRSMIDSYKMSLAAHKGEFEHFTDIALCWENVFTPFVSGLVGTRQSLPLMKQMTLEYFNEKMSQTRVFWDESGHHNINWNGFMDEATQQEIDAYRLTAYGQSRLNESEKRSYAKVTSASDKSNADS